QTTAAIHTSGASSDVSDSHAFTEAGVVPLTWPSILGLVEKSADLPGKNRSRVLRLGGLDAMEPRTSRTADTGNTTTTGRTPSVGAMALLETPWTRFCICTPRLLRLSTVTVYLSLAP